MVRRLFFYWMFVAVVVLPSWLLVGWAAFGAGGWAVLGVFFAAMGLGIGLLGVSLIIYARREVRETRAVSWADVGWLTLWHILVIGVGFYAEASPWLSVLAIIVTLGAYWYTIWELYDAARRRVLEVMVLIDETARAVTPPVDLYPPETPPTDPSIIVIREKPTQP